ncbi:MAG: response regulator [Terriglobales bacterium]
MSAELILVVEDDADVAGLVRLQLEREGFRTIHNATGAGLAAQIEVERPALVLLDLMLPAASGLALLRQLRRDPRYRELPVIVLTALSEERDRVRGLDLGAADYITKPFSGRELAARVRARLRERAAPAERLEAGALRLDLTGRAAALAGAPLALSDTEFRLLVYLMRHPGRALARREILDAVWAPGHFITERTVDVYMRRLRAKLEPAGGQRFLTAVRQVGYRFDPPEPDRS